MKCHNCNKWVEKLCPNPDECSCNTKSFGTKVSELLRGMVNNIKGIEPTVKVDNKSDNK